MSCCSKNPSRRSILATGGLITAVATLSACSAEPQQDNYTGGTLTEAVELSALDVGAAVQLIVGSQQILLFREAAETVHAYSAVCTHQGCIVGIPDNEATAPFVCPCHASNFDKASGAVVSGPAQLPLTRHRTALQDGWVLVEVEPH